ncbi:MAG: HDIG domain-containing protein [Chloroflexi bacterium]|nr:HDIG domain-containing protein [Chloroflexota bacterium]
MPGLSLSSIRVRWAAPPLTAGPGGPHLAWALGLVFGTALLLTLVLTVDLLPRTYELHVGDVAQADIKAPRKAAYVSQIRTREAADQAAAQVPPVVELDRNRISQLMNGLSQEIQAISSSRAVPNRTPDQRREAIHNLLSPPLSDTAVADISDTDDAHWAALGLESQRLLQTVLQDRIADDNLQQEQELMPLRVSPAFADPDRSVIAELAARFVAPNTVVNEDATNRARQDARDAVAPVVQTYERGQTIVRDGQVVGPADLEALQALGLGTSELDWRSFAATGLLVGVLMALLSGFVWCFDRLLLQRDRRMLLIAGLLILAMVAAKMIVPSRPLWVYVFPLPAVSILIAILFEARLAMVLGVIISILLAWMVGGSLEVAVIGIVGTFVGSLDAWRRERLSAYFLAGVYVAVAMIVVYTAFFLQSRSDDWSTLSLVSFELAVNGVLSALLAVGSFALLGRVFGILTTMQLLELANPTQPLLRRLLLEAPGTYHHSIMVGNLAERAAEEIGADSLLVRVAAYYHDIGKLDRPWAFIENQSDPSTNIHESLDPLTSAQMIAAHVPDGVRLAVKYDLPARIREMIPEHHGTRTISFFYQQAAEQTTEALDPAPFTYPGPRPQSREAALLMLADSTEAAARAARDHTRPAIQELVERIVYQRLDEGQFDECNLTLRDLTRIKQSFVTLLTGIYHPRIPYPPARSAPVLPAPTDAPV